MDELKTKNYRLVNRGMFSIFHSIVKFYFPILIFLAFSIRSSWALLNPVMSYTTQEFHDFFLEGQGSKNAKLVFVHMVPNSQEKKLCYIDFSEALVTPVIRMIKAVTDAHVPVISPDGSWVVYATGTGTEAGSPVSNRSSVYLCKLDENASPVLLAADSACEPRFMQEAENLTVIYPTLAPNYAWEGYGKTMKIEIDVSSGSPVPGTPEVVFEHGSYTGGLSWDGNYLCGGGGDIAMLDLTSGNTRPDTVSAYSQSCNASISSSQKFTNTMMHLTFNGSHPLINGGKPWTSWQTILLNNSDSKIIQGYWYPTEFKFTIQTDPESFTEGFARWHHPEWSNHPYFASATFNPDRYFQVGSEYVNTYYQERIYLINLKDSLFIEVFHPDTIHYSGTQNDNSGHHWPWLWVALPDDFQEDSTWLSVPTNIHQPKYKSFFSNPQNQIKVMNNTLIAPYAISSIRLFLPNGRLITSVNFTYPQKIITLKSLDQVSSGTYVLQVKTKQNQLYTMYLGKF